MKHKIIITKSHFKTSHQMTFYFRGLQSVEHSIETKLRHTPGFYDNPFLFTLQHHCEIIKQTLTINIHYKIYLEITCEKSR